MQARTSASITGWSCDVFVSVPSLATCMGMPFLCVTSFKWGKSIEWQPPFETKDAAQGSLKSRLLRDIDDSICIGRTCMLLPYQVIARRTRCCTLKSLSFFSENTCHLPFVSETLWVLDVRRAEVAATMLMALQCFVPSQRIRFLFSSVMY